MIIAESQQDVAEELRQDFTHAGYDVIAIASTGEEAIKKVKNLKPEIVVLDIYLGGEISGEKAAKIIKEFSSASIMLCSTYKDIPAITNELEKDGGRLQSNLEENKQIISYKEKVISNKKNKQGDVYV